MTYTEVLALFEAGEIEFMSALELVGCDTLIELYEGAADEQENALRGEERHPSTHSPA